MPADDKKSLMSLDDALARIAPIAARHRIEQTETLPTFAALGRVLAQDLISPLDVPPADNSAMDGYALRAADVGAAGAVLPVVQRIAAGGTGAALAAGTAARIFTGAWVPAGADAVVMQEHCQALTEPAPGTAASYGAVRVLKPPRAGQNIRRRGEDLSQGRLVLAAGTRLTPPALGLAATAGAAQLTVLRRPRVALLTTGNELTMPGEPLPPGGIYNANRYTLCALLEAAGCAVTDLGCVADRLDDSRAALRQAAAGCDLIITSGGVSVGEEDHLRAAAQAEGRIELWQLAIKPGKPLLFGSIRRHLASNQTPSDVDAAARAGEALLVGLPGNPVSSFVTFLIVVAPLLRVMQGVAVDLHAALPAALAVKAAFDWPKPAQRREFLRVRRNAAGALELFANQSSGVLTSTVWADGLVDNPPGQAIAAGDVLRYWPMAALISA